MLSIRKWKWLHWLMTFLVTSTLFFGVNAPLRVEAAVYDTALQAAVGPNDIVLDSTEAERINSPAATANTNKWGSATTDANKGILYNDNTHRINIIEGIDGATAQYTPNIPQPGIYEVFITFGGASNRASNVKYEISHNSNTDTVYVDQTSTASNGQWYSLGEYDFSKGGNNYVKIDTTGARGWVMADAVRFKPVSLEPADKDDDATLSALVVSPDPGTLNFSPEVTDYSFEVFNTVHTIDVTPTVSSAVYKSLTVDGQVLSSQSSFTKTLAPGLNTIEIMVTAEDGTVKTYYINVIQLSHDGSLSNNARLRSLAINPGVLGFNPDVTDYSISVENSVANIEISPTADSESYKNLTIKKFQTVSGSISGGMEIIEGNAQSAGAYTIGLEPTLPRDVAGSAVNSNTITISVKAEDDYTVKTYTIYITRESADPINDKKLRDQVQEGDVVVDNTDLGVIRTGVWSPSRVSEGKYFGGGYEFVDGKLGKGQTIQYNPTIPAEATYEVYALYNGASNRADKVLYEINHKDGKTVVEINQKNNGGMWVPLGTFDFEAGNGSYVKIDSAGTNGFVMADAIRFAVPMDPGDNNGSEKPELKVNYAPAGDVIFQSGFEAGSTGVPNPSDPGTIQDIIGKDLSFDTANDWEADLDGYAKFGDFAFQYAPGTNASERTAKIIDDPTRSDGGNKVLSYWLGSVGDAADRGRIQSYFTGNEGLEEVYYTFRMYLHPDLELIKQSFDSNGWFTISEFWNQPSWKDWTQYPFRVALNLTKEIGIDKPFNFRVSSQTTPITGDDSVAREFTTIWEDKNYWSVPTGKWLDCEIYYKEGDQNTGRFYFAVTPEGEAKKVLFNVTNWTHHPELPAAGGLTDFHPFKMYTGKDLTNFVKSKGGALQIYWDDIAFYPSIVSLGNTNDPSLGSLRVSPGTLSSASEPDDIGGSMTAIDVNSTVTNAVYDGSKQVVILKLDDLKSTNYPLFQNIADYVKEIGIKASFGVIGNSLEDDGQKQAYYDAIKNWDKNGIEIWHHGYEHVITEYNASPFESQMQSFGKTVNLLKEKTEINVRSFGSPYNNSDSTTVQVLNQFPGVKVKMLARDPQEEGKQLNLNTRADMETEPGVVDYNTFVSNYMSYKRSPYIVLQGHPGMWDSHSVSEFKKIVDFLLSENVEFLTPYEYNLALNGMDLAPSFDSSIKTYAATVDENTDAVAIIAAAKYSGATIAQGDTGVKRLLPGLNTFHIHVTAQDGIATDTYTLEITRNQKQTGEDPDEENPPPTGEDPDEENPPQTGSGPEPEQPKGNEPAVIKGAVLEATATVNPATGNAKSEIDLKSFNTALGQAKPDNKGVRKVEINVVPVQSSRVYEIVLPAGILTNASQKETLEISTAVGNIEINGNELKMLKGAAANITFIIGAVEPSDIDSKTREAAGNRPVIHLSIAVDGNRIEGRNPDASVRVSIPYSPTPEELKEPEHIVVKYMDKAGNMISVPSGKYDIATGSVSFSTNHFGNYAIAFDVKTFTDIAAFGWAQKEIEVLASKGIINGTGNGTFNPGAGISRADFILLLVNTLNLTASVDSNFNDVGQEEYYYEAVGIAKKLGIALGGGNNKFNPLDRISRQDMMTLTARAMNVAGKLDLQGTKDDLVKFKDHEDMAAYAADNVSALINAGIIQGNGQFVYPLSNTTRAEAALMLYRIYNKQHN